MNKIKYIFIHHSASDWGTAKDINLWHLQRGFKGIGYHFVVRNGYPTYLDWHKKNLISDQVGLIEKGRPLNADEWLQANECGAHALGFNSESIGICLIHNNADSYNPVQLESYRKLTAGLALHFNIPIENIKGHYEVDPRKPLCPALNMNDERIILKNCIKLRPEFEKFALQYLK